MKSTYLKEALNFFVSKTFELKGKNEFNKVKKEVEKIRNSNLIKI